MGCHIGAPAAPRAAADAACPVSQVVNAAASRLAESQECSTSYARSSVLGPTMRWQVLPGARRLLAPPQALPPCRRFSCI